MKKSTRLLQIILACVVIITALAGLGSFLSPTVDVQRTTDTYDNSPF